MRRTLHEGAWIRLVLEGRWEFAQRTKGRSVVAVAALDLDRNLILVEQHRPSLSGPVIELPAGLVGDEDDAPMETEEDAAKRELEEETGHRGGRWCSLHRGPVSAGLTDEVVHLFAAEGVSRHGRGGGVGGEAITVHCVPLDQFEQQLAEWRRRGIPVDTKVVTAWLYFQ